MSHLIGAIQLENPPGGTGNGAIGEVSLKLFVPYTDTSITVMLEPYKAPGEKPTVPGVTEPTVTVGIMKQVMLSKSEPVSGFEMGGRQYQLKLVGIEQVDRGGQRSPRYGFELLGD